MERRLRAIFAMDMVGYSLRMEADEINTLKAHRSLRDRIIDPTIADANGRVVKEMGDGILAEFASATEAVQAAIDIQEKLAADSEDQAGENPVRYRIGINLGDIFSEGGDIFGDGVNVAARLEQIADPGGICISGTIFDQLRSSVNADFETMGELQVKNIQRPIRAYRVTPEGTLPATSNPPAAGDASAKSSGIPILAAIAGFVMIAALAGWYFLQSPEKSRVANEHAETRPVSATSIAIFPFSRLGTDNSDDYLRVGIAEDLITELSVVPDLLVVTPGSFADPDSVGSNLRQISRDASVATYLSGSVRRAGETLRVNARLIDVSSGANIWAKTYDRPSNETISVSQDIATDIIAALPVTVENPDRSKRERNFYYPDPRAYDLLLKGNLLLARLSPGSLVEAAQRFREALAIDPDFPRAHAQLAYALALQLTLDIADDPASIANQVQQEANTALERDMTIHQAHLAKGLLYRSQRRFDAAIKAFDTVLDIHPHGVDAYALGSLTFLFSGRPEKALEMIDDAIRRNPDYPFNYKFSRGMSLFTLERYDEAATDLEEAVGKNPDFIPARSALAATYGKLGRAADAQWEYQEILARKPEFSVISEQARIPFSRLEDLTRYIDGLKVAAGQTS